MNKDTDIKKMLSDIRQQVDKALTEDLMQKILSRTDDYEKHAQDNGEYRDRTGNLRWRSIETGITVEGKTITATSKEAQKKFVESGMKDPKNGFSVFIASTAPYAEAVEAKGFNVLGKTGKYMKDDIKKILEDEEKDAKNASRQR